MMLAKVRELTERMRRSNHCVRHGWACTLFSSTCAENGSELPWEMGTKVKKVCGPGERMVGKTTDFMCCAHWVYKLRSNVN